jgi:hypothetical protein
MSLFDSVGIKNAQIAPYINTGTLFDIALGQFEKSYDDRWILNGGIAPITGVCGRAGTYKSTVVDSIIIQILLRYPQIECWKHDSEQNVFSLVRFEKMADGKIDVNTRFRLTNATSHTFAEVIEGLQELCAFKEKNRKDYIVPSPFLDLSGNRLNTWVPTIVDIDSFTCMRTVQEEGQSEKVGLEDGARNMDDMFDGKVKRKFMFDISRWASKFGIYFLMTAHVDDTCDIDPRRPAQKQLQFLRQGDRLKGVGSQFEFLTNVLLQGTSPTPIVDAKKGPEYPTGNESNIDINELSVKILRCKTNATGTIIPLVMSQHLGILGPLTNYHFLKNNGDYGFAVKGHNRYSLFSPDLLLHRNSIIESLHDNYEACRGLEILAQLKWVAMFWNTKAQPVDIPETATEFVEKIHASNSIAVEDILNSRGHWSLDETKEDRKYMSLYDILQIIGKK